MRRLGAVIDRLFAYKAPEKAASKRKTLRAKKRARPKRPAARG